MERRRAAQPPRGDQFPWKSFLAGSALLITIVYLVWELAQQLLIREPIPPAVFYFYLPRGIAASALVAAFGVGMMHRRVVQLESRIRVAQAAEARFRALVESAPDAVVIADRLGRIVLVNTRAEALFNTPRAQMLGKTIESLLPGAASELSAASLPGAGTRTLRVQGRRGDGTEFPAEVGMSPVEAEGLLLTAVVRDLTERIQLEEERIASMERLQELERLQEMDKFKTEFINMAAHEVFTPLTPIRLQLDLLKREGAGLSEEQRRALEVLDRNVERLQQLVQDVLEVARMQAGRLGIQKQPVDLNRVVLEAMESFEAQARGAGIQLESRLAPDLRAEADPRRITQVLFNLLSNALKYTPAGGKVVIETGREQGGALVRVTDTGIGLRGEDLGRLFRPFTQLPEARQRTRAGTGLGLYISRGIVELHGGRVWVDSPGPGKGSTFAFSLPPEVAAVPPPEEAVAVKEDTLAHRAKELI